MSQLEINFIASILLASPAALAVVLAAIFGLQGSDTNNRSLERAAVLCLVLSWVALASAWVVLVFGVAGHGWPR